MLEFVNANYPFLLGIAGLLILTALIWLIRLEWRLKKLLLGKQGGNLEGAVLSVGRQIQETDKINGQIKQHLIGMEERLRRSIQHVKTVRFNPFRDQGQGGNQSFAVAFLDESKNGTVISSLYSRDKVSIYAKPISAGQSTHELSAEEQEAVKQ
jgi:hypothetical protein